MSGKDAEETRKRGPKSPPIDSGVAFAHLLQRFLAAEPSLTDIDVATASGLHDRTIRNAKNGKGKWATWEAIAGGAAARAKTSQGKKLADELLIAVRGGGDSSAEANPTLELTATEPMSATTVAEPRVAAIAPRRSRAVEVRLLAVAFVLVSVVVLWFLASRRVADSPASEAGVPLLTIDGRSRSVRSEGESFLLRATGLTPCGKIARWERPARYPRPGQTEMQLEETANPDGSFDFAMTVGCEVNDDTYLVGLDDLGTGRKSNQVAAIVLSNGRCGPHLSDLQIEDVALQVGAARAGASVAVEFSQVNAGRLPAGASRTRVRLGPAQERTNINDRVLGDVEVPAIAPGDRVSGRATVTIPADVESGTYFLWLVADNEMGTLESVSSNNFAKSSALVVTGLPPGACAAARARGVSDPAR